LESTDKLTPLLSLSGVSVAYGKAEVVHEVDLVVHRGSVTTLLGHNGAGKTTTLGAAFGSLPIRSGSVSFKGRDVKNWSAARRAREGVSFIPAVEFVFPDLTVEENLDLANFAAKADRATVQSWLEEVHARWPILAERKTQIAGTLSGGERRMLSLGVALMTDPAVLLLDEPSLGLSPVLADNLLADLRTLADERGIGVLLVEQAVSKALAIADDAYVIRSGRIIAHEPAAELAKRQSLWDLF